MRNQPPIAIVGISGLFPGAPDLETYWRNIVNRVDTTARVPAERWIVDPRVMVDSGEFSGHTGEKAIASSKGVRASEAGGFFYCYIFGMAKEGETVSSFDFQYDGARSPSAIDPSSVARRFAENVVASLGAEKGESFKGPVILAPKAASEILIEPIESSVKASSVQRETSKFAGRLGSAVASPLLSC